MRRRAPKWYEFFQDDDGDYCVYRVIFLISILSIFLLVFLQFFGVGMISDGLYLILATAGSGGYVGAVLKDRDIRNNRSIYDQTTDIDDESKG